LQEKAALGLLFSFLGPATGRFCSRYLSSGQRDKKHNTAQHSGSHIFFREQ
jgi:hypothetical protein